MAAFFLFLGIPLKSENSGALKAVSTPPVCDIPSYYHSERCTLGGSTLMESNLTLKCTVMKYSSFSAPNQRVIAQAQDGKARAVSL